MCLFCLLAKMGAYCLAASDWWSSPAEPARVAWGVAQTRNFNAPSLEFRTRGNTGVERRTEREKLVRTRESACGIAHSSHRP